MAKPNPQTYRGKDVTGALALIRSLMEWDLMPKDEQPKTDREAAALFFRIDRSNASMAEFQASLQEFRVEELEHLTKQPRKPPKKAHKRRGPVLKARFPQSLTLPRKAYDKLLHLTRWVDDTPADVELGEHAWDGIQEKMARPVEIALKDDTIYVTSVQIETTATSSLIAPGTLVALLETNEKDEPEFHCVLVRGVK